MLNTVSCILLEMNIYPVLSTIYGQLRGYDRWRIEHQVHAATGRTREEILDQQGALLQERVHDAIGRFPVYAEKVRAHCGSLPRRGDQIRIEELPVWVRGDQSRCFDAISAAPLRGSFVNATGGSTGVPLRYWVTRQSWEWRTAVSDRGYSWAGAQKGVRSLYVWGTAIHPPGRLAAFQGRISAWMQGRTFFDSFDFGDSQKKLCCSMINRRQPLALVGYTGNLVALATFVRDNPDLLRWKARALVTAAEGLHDGQRELFERWLADEVFVSYGSREFMLIGMECWKHHGYHLSADNLMVEVVDDNGAPVAPGILGRILITDLRNLATPFIRYEIGDMGAMAEPGRECPCGLPFPMLERVDGRIQEVIVKPDGEKLTALFIPHLMKEFDWIDGYQIMQGDPGDIVVNLVTTRELTDELTRPIQDLLKQKLGADMQIAFRRVAALHRNMSGKTPIVITGKEI